MVRDGIYYALGALAVGVSTAWAAGPAWAAIPLALGVFFLWFFRDPERRIPSEAGVIVSPADGKVTALSTMEVNGVSRRRISIFLSVFDVHVNRSPIAGTVRNVEYRRGRFRNAMGADSSDCNEQNVVTVDGEASQVVFKQIAGLLARRIVFTKKIGEQVLRGERVGLIKFGSRVDVIFDAEATPQVKVGEHVRGGSTILALARQTTQVSARSPQQQATTQPDLEASLPHQRGET